MKDINDFTNDIIKTIKSVAREHAINRPTNDAGITIKISNADIKEATGRGRIKEPVIKKVMNNFQVSGMEVERVDNGLSVFCPPLLEDKGVYTLKEIEERKKMIDDLNIIQDYKNQL